MERISIELGSGLTLSALTGGSGQPLIMIPGWSQTAAEWQQNAETLTEHRRVIALDMRGHGESDKPNYGYRVGRLAKDLSEVLDELGLSSVDLLGHSMGCAVIWAYLDLFGPNRVQRLVLVDQAPCMFPQAQWSDEQRSRFGCFYQTADDVDEFAKNVLAASDRESTTELLKGLFSPGFSTASLQTVAKENLKLPRPLAAQLLRDTAYGDWRDVIERIKLPTLVIGGENSIFTSASQRWIASVISGAEVEIFPTSEGGSHFMFIENPSRFNSCILSFLASSNTQI